MIEKTLSLGFRLLSPDAAQYIYSIIYTHSLIHFFVLLLHASSTKRLYKTKYNVHFPKNFFFSLRTNDLILMVHK